MRRRITRALLASATVGATITTMGLAAAGSAGAAAVVPAAGAAHRAFTPSGGPPIYTPPCSDATGFQSIDPAHPLDLGGCAGYVGSGRDFRYTQAIITIPSSFAIDLSDTDAPTMYVGLSSSDAAAAAGVMSCNVAEHVFGTNPCGVSGTSGWVAVGLFAWNSGMSLTDQVVPLTGISPGTGVFFSIYYNQQGNSLRYTITTNPTSSSPTVHAFAFDAHGAVFNHVAALADYSGCTTAVPPSPSDCGEFAVPGHAPLQDIRITQFFQGAWTTANGQRGTFSGPWNLNPAIVTSQGQPPPGNQVQVEPAYLWNDGMGNGWGDAFGVWWRHNA
jgi:hypothetical protein